MPESLHPYFESQLSESLVPVLLLYYKNCWLCFFQNYSCYLSPGLTDNYSNLRVCEICGSTARNVTGANEAELTEQWNEASDAVTTTAMTAPPPVQATETRNFWQGHRFLNFLLACMVFAFVISWLFHFNIPS